MEKLWNLDKLYTGFDSPEFQKDFSDMKEGLTHLTDWAKENFAHRENPKEKLEYYVNAINSYSRYLNLSRYAHLILAVDSVNPQAAKMQDLSSDILSGLAVPDTLFNTFVGDIENLEEVIESSSLLKEHGFVLGEAKRKRAYVLSEKEESVIAKMVTTGSDAWGNMKEQLAATILVDMELNGEKKSVPLTVARNMAHDADPNVRKTAYQAELAAYEKIDKAVSFALNSIKGEALNQVKIRGYESPLHMTLIDSRLEKTTLDAMIAAIQEKLPSLRRFFRKKAEVLGHQNGLPFYDLFAPVGSVDIRFTYEEAAEYVIKNFYSFSEDMGNFARRAFDEAWIDAEPREGKTGGAFCANLHSIGESRIMSNFAGSFKDMSTLAHELGHGYHGDCLKDCSYLNSEYPMPIAETASTFCETIVFNAALKEASKEEAFVILENEITEMTQVIVDIYSRYLFETWLFEGRAQGPLSVGEIKDLMIRSQKEAYGDGLDHNFLHPYMWICKPHYYYASSNFYNFPYAYGLLFAQGLYAEFVKQGKEFPPKYRQLLAATGCHSLEDVGKMAGIDVSDRAFWLSSLQVVENKIDEFCRYE